MSCIDSSNLHKTLAKKYGIPEPVIRQVCNSPFMFTKKIMADDNDEYPMMFAGLFKLRLKKRFRQGNKKNYYKKNRESDTWTHES